MKVRGKHIVLSFVLLVTGFILAYSYELTTERKETLMPGYEKQWEYEDKLRDQINQEEEKIASLQEQLQIYQMEVRHLEENLASIDEEQEMKTKALLEEIDRLRKVIGQVKVEGPGVEVMLEDATYLPENANPNDYIVHEFHVQLVVHELYVAGAEAIAINGYRLTKDSYIQCTGPVIEVDGNISPAPFIITAIGDPEHLQSALSLYGGVRDQLVNDEINVRIQPKNNITIDPPLTEGGM